MSFKKGFVERSQSPPDESMKRTSSLPWRPVLAGPRRLERGSGMSALEKARLVRCTTES